MYTHTHTHTHTHTIMGQWEDGFIATLVDQRSTSVSQLHVAFIYIVCIVDVGNTILFYSILTKRLSSFEYFNNNIFVC